MTLERFKNAQDIVYHRVVSELAQGQKVSHWMWYIFPQIDGLGQSAMAVKFAIKNSSEARAYLNDPLLAGRLNECCELLLQIPNKSALDILGNPDHIKLRSSMTLFAFISEPGSVYQKVLDRFYGGVFDPLTIEKLTQ